MAITSLEVKFNFGKWRRRHPYAQGRKMLVVKDSPEVALAVFWGAVSLPTEQPVALMSRLALKSPLLHQLKLFGVKQGRGIEEGFLMWLHFP